MSVTPQQHCSEAGHLPEATRGDTKQGPRTPDPTVGADVNALYDAIRSSVANAGDISTAILSPAVKTLHVFGTVLYEDVFGDWHHTDFCVKYAPGAAPGGNYAWINCGNPGHNTVS